MPSPLQPNITSAQAPVAKADVATLIAAITAVTAMPQGKTTDKLQRYTLTINADGSGSASAQFKP